MKRLWPRDVRLFNDLVRELYVAADLEALQARLIAGIPKVVASEITLYFELNPRDRRAIWASAPANALSFLDADRTFELVKRESPLLPSYRQGEGSAVKISDFLTQHQLHRTGLYNEIYRRVGIEYQIAKGLPAAPPEVRALVLHRSMRDFSERDRLILNLLRPHLAQAYRNAESVTAMRDQLALITEGVEKLDRGITVVCPMGRPRLMTSRAQQWMGEYFGHQSRPAGRLPEALDRWVRSQQALPGASGDVPAARKPLMVERDGKRLVVRLISSPDRTFLLFEERHSQLPLDHFELAGLSRREAEVLAWVARGKTNAEIGFILETSPRTVDKHLEHIYRKLGVETRTAAAARALSLTPVGS